MKTTILTSITTLALMTITAGAKADQPHPQLRHFDDVALQAAINLHEVRWDIHDQMTSSRQYNGILKSADDLSDDLANLQRLIRRERNPRHVDRELDHTLDHLNGLRQQLLTSDMAQWQQGGFQTLPSGAGYSFQPTTRNPGNWIVQGILGKLSGVEQTLQHLHVELTGQPGGNPGNAIPLPSPVPNTRPHLPPVSRQQLPSARRPSRVPVHTTHWPSH